MPSESSIYFNSSILISSTDSLLLDTNSIEGSLPSAIGELSLKTFHVHRNQLEGPIPDELWGVTELDSLRLDSNSFSGTLPDAIGDLVNVKRLLLDRNALTGPVPILLGRLSNLGMFASFLP
jgi:hypothetical protein